MNLRELIKEIERLKHLLKVYDPPLDDIYYEALGKLIGIKQTVEAVDNKIIYNAFRSRDREDWEKLKTLLEIKG